MIDKKFSRIVGIGLKPVTRIAEPKTVTPGIHIRHQAITTDILNIVRKDNLQVTNGRLLKVITACITIKIITPLAIHADDMAGLMQERMYRCISSNKDSPSHNASFGFAPEAASNGCAIRLDNKFETKTRE